MATHINRKNEAKKKCNSNSYDSNTGFQFCPHFRWQMPQLWANTARNVQRIFSISPSRSV